MNTGFQVCHILGMHPSDVDPHRLRKVVFTMLKSNEKTGLSGTSPDPIYPIKSLIHISSCYPWCWRPPASE